MPVILNFLLLVAAGLCAAFVANDFDWSAIAWQRVRVALLGVAPLVPAFFLLRSRRARSIGIAYATAGGLVGALVLALPAGLLLFLADFESDRVQRIDTLILASYEATLIALALAGAAAFLGQQRSERAYLSLFVSALAVGAYAGFVSWLVQGGALHVPHERLSSVLEVNDARAGSAPPRASRGGDIPPANRKS